MIEKFESPAAWRGTALFKRPDWEYRLSVEELAEIERALRRIKRRGLSLTKITREDFELPRLEPVLASVQEGLENGSGAARIRGITPGLFDEDDVRLIFWGLARHIGTPVSQSAKGELMFSVRDEGFGEQSAKTRGPNTNKRLRFHTDRCDVIGFHCVRQAKIGGDNLLVSSITLHNEILERRPDLLMVLYKPFYYKRHNVDTGNPLPYLRQPVFAIHQGHFIGNVLRVLIERAHTVPGVPPLTPVQREALDFLDEVAEETELHVRFRQEPGDMLFINNFVVFHRRDAFEDHGEPSLRRHLLRLWLSVPNSRPLSESFRANYREIEAGAIRGGMPPIGPD
ncbi:TauD/TfdA family dioxygenase [Sulfidibacter corallicola]|uniref:TauD/TfdA family dioxygenase n=1 Tax=Sulfidibacter corallicola TaxID=2818388 RepID=A0A8A4TGF6_SULCO|nr:TauD/TfdA family dioxygenase [Sulfidibacter corallicola]QTD47808.1 TauD/TfdA family dioxygenase [Sulfidibacter corallicola]